MTDQTIISTNTPRTSRLAHGLEAVLHYSLGIAVTLAAAAGIASDGAAVVVVVPNDQAVWWKSYHGAPEPEVHEDATSRTYVFAARDVVRVGTRVVATGELLADLTRILGWRPRGSVTVDRIERVVFPCRWNLDGESGEAVGGPDGG